jgi:hypothetical protein
VWHQLRVVCDPSFLAQAFFASYNQIEALPLWAKLHRESPKSARICELIASSHGFLGKWGEMERLSLLALRDDPSFYHAHYTLGVAAKQLNDCPKVCQVTGALVDLCTSEREVVFGLVTEK